MKTEIFFPPFSKNTLPHVAYSNRFARHPLQSMRNAFLHISPHVVIGPTLLYRLFSFEIIKHVRLAIKSSKSKAKSKVDLFVCTEGELELYLKYIEGPGHPNTNIKIEIN